MTDKSLRALPRLGIRGLLRNAGALFSGNMAASILGLIALAIIARNVDSAAFGQFSLIVAYVFVIDGLFSFQSWQAVIKFGTDAQQNADEGRFCALIRLGLAIDVTTAVLAAAVGAVAVYWVGRFVGLQDAEAVASAACLVLLSRFFGTASAILRVRGRFELIAWQQAIVGVVRLALVAAAAAASSSIWAFVLAWFLAEGCGNLALFGLGWRQLSAAERSAVLSGRLVDLAPVSRAVWKFLWASNAHSTVKLALREADMLAVGAMLGPAAAGLYRVVKQIAAVAGKVMAPLYLAVYPDLSRAYASGARRDFWRVAVLPGLALGTLLAVFVAIFFKYGSLVIEVVLGPEYQAAAGPAGIYMIGTVLSALTFSFQPAALALGAAGRSLAVLTVSTAIYFISFVYLGVEYGLEGVAWAYVVFYVVWSLLMARMLVVVSASAQWRQEKNSRNG